MCFIYFFSTVNAADGVYRVDAVYGVYATSKLGKLWNILSVILVRLN